MNQLHAASTPIRLALCITELEGGGAERCLVELATRLDRREFDPVVYCLGSRPASNPCSLVDVLEQAGIEVVCFGGRTAWDALGVFWRLRRRMLRDRPQLLQTFLFHANVLAAAAARWAGVARVVTGIRVAERRPNAHLRWARLADRWVDLHVCVSHEVRKFSAEKGGLCDAKLRVIPNGVDVTRFAAAKSASCDTLGLRPERRALLFIGRLEAQKRVDWLLRLLPEVLGRLPQHDLLVVGDGAERGALEAAARANPRVAERVHFLGFRADVPQLLAASDLLLLPSAWEGMPNVVLEAMAAGKPVVATDVEGVAEALGPGAAGQCAAGCKPNQGPGGAADRASQVFADQVVAIADDPALAHRLGRQNQARARQHFSFEAMVSAYRQLYFELLQDIRQAPQK